MSGHLPVITSSHLERTTKRSFYFTPRAVRQDARVSESAKECYRQAAPSALAALRSAENQEQFNESLAILETVLKLLWMANYRIRTHRFRSFWTSQLDYKSKRRSRQYRTALRTCSAVYWQPFRDLVRVIKQEARRNKERCFMKSLSSLPSQGASKVTMILRKITKARQLRACLRRKIGREHDPVVFSAHIHTVSYTPKEADPCTLRLPLRPGKHSCFNPTLGRRSVGPPGDRVRAVTICSWKCLKRTLTSSAGSCVVSGKWLDSLRPSRTNRKKRY